MKLSSARDKFIEWSLDMLGLRCLEFPSRVIRRAHYGGTDFEVRYAF